MTAQWLGTNAATLALVLVSGIGIYVTLLALTRLAGLRSFSKMSSFDFATTVAFGSIIASTLLSRPPPLATAMFALAVLYALQYGTSLARRRSVTIQRLVDNEPLLLMDGERILWSNLARARLTEDDLRAKLRMAGIIHLRAVRAVVFETTGDISVLRDGETFDPWLLAEVRGAPDAARCR